MNKLLLPVLLLLSACAPFTLQPNDSTKLTVYREGATVRVVAAVGPRLGIASSAPITAYQGAGCEVIPTDAGAADGTIHAIACPAPVTVVVTTTGEVVARVRDGNTTVAGPTATK